jgi:hypothetical protein
MEGFMNGYSELVIFFLILPAATQLIIPLLLPIGFILVNAVRTVSGVRKVAGDAMDDLAIPETWQFRNN